MTDLVVRYGSFAAVDGVDLRVDRGQVVALLGPNGAGKTTTVETIEGYRRPDGGRVRVFGLDPVDDHDVVMSHLGVMLQAARLYSAIRPIEAVRLFASYHAEPVTDPAALLERVGLGSRARTPWRRLSGGEQQRLALALALVGRPELVILDEPTAGLDVEGRQLVRELIGSLRAEGMGVLLTTHELDEAERVADRVVIMTGGKVVADGTLGELASQGPEAGLWFRAQDGHDLAALEAVLGGPVRRVGGGEYEASTAVDPGTVARLATWLADRGDSLAELRPVGGRLEDVYRRLVEDTKR